MIHKTLFQKKMFLLTILLLIVSIFFGGVELGYNQTTNWVYDNNFWVFLIKPFLWTIFLIGYGLLTTMGYTTNKNLSILHLIFISLLIMIDDLLNYDSGIILIMLFISTIIFTLNFISSIRNKNSKFLIRK